MQANLKCDRLEDRAFKNARSTIHSLHPFGDTNTWFIPVVSAKIWKRIVRPSSLYSLFIIYERKRHKDLLNILDAFKNVFFFICKTWKSNILLYHDALRTPVLFKLLFKSAKKIWFVYQNLYLYCGIIL